jgi:hypothetical protein
LEHAKCALSVKHLFVYVTDDAVPEAEQKLLEANEIAVDSVALERWFGPFLALRRMYSSQATPGSQYVRV